MTGLFETIPTGRLRFARAGSPRYFSYTDDVRVLNNVQPIQENGGDSGVDISNVTDIQVNGNSFVNAVAALYGYNNQEGNSSYSSCGNQIVGDGHYDQSVACLVSSIRQ